MTETSHARSRRAALFGLAIQIAVAAATFGLAATAESLAMLHLAWYLVGGIPIWLAALLVFRQHELAALEALDLEELRREKQATGGGEAIFGQEGGGGLGFIVAETRLHWMRRWLVPGFGLATAVYLVAFGVWCFRSLEHGITQPGWAPLTEQVSVAIVMLAVLMLFLFLFARFASGLARVPEWQLLRACGSYMLGTAVAALAVIISFGVHLYADVGSWEHTLAYVIPVLMALLGLETVLNFVLDIYRPRTPGVEPRACFDSRILGLISEPGGIAHTVAEAINYQFGFQVSQTWFYQLLQRAAVPLAAAGAVALWLMSSVVVVQPYERGIVERFGAQLNADSPLGPGLHFKWPWPIARVSKFNTEQLHQIVIGHKLDLDEAEKDVHEEEELGVEQWTDEQHAGHEHHEFIVAPPASLAAEGATRRSASARGAPVHLLRMKVVVQYRIMETRLGEYSRQAADAHRLLRDLSWQEVLRFNAGSDVASLLGELRSRAGGMLAERIRKRCDDLGLGLEIVYVGLLGVHPNQSVAKEYRQVIGAEQEKIAKIQQARDKENEILSRVAGDKQTALALAEATKKTQENESAFNAAEQELQARQPPVTQDLLDQADALGAVLTSRIEARWRLDQANTTLQNIKKDAAWGIGHSERDIKDAEQAVQQARAGWAAADRAFELAATPLRIELGKQLDESTIATVLRRAEARFALDFWNARVEGLIPDLRGAAAVVLAEAQARRWEVEMQAAGEVARLEADRHAYAVAPRVYRARRYLQVLAGGLSNARKYFLAFDPGEREVRLILDAQEEVRPEDLAVPTGQP